MTQSEQGTPFAKWLNDNKLTYEGFARTVDVSAGAVYAWAAGIRHPQHLAKNAIKRVYPDCPLVAPEKKNIPEGV